MKIHFDSKKVPPTTVKKVLEFLYETYNNPDIEINSISLYVTMKNKDNDNDICFIAQDKNGEDKEIEWYIKPHELEKTNKQLLKHIKSKTKSNEDIYIYKKLKKMYVKNKPWS